MSAATINGFLPCLMSMLASLAAVVVLPEPCRPTIMMPARPPPSLRLVVSSAPSKPRDSSWQILTKWSSGAYLHLLACFVGGRDLHHLAHGLVLHPGDEALDHFEADVGLEEADADVPRRASSTSSSVISALPVSRFLAALNPLATVSSMRCALFWEDGTVPHPETRGFMPDRPPQIQLQEGDVIQRPSFSRLHAGAPPPGSPGFHAAGGWGR